LLPAKVLATTFPSRRIGLMLADELDYVIGVDTHRDQHALAVVDVRTGAVVAQTTTAAEAHGYTRALRFAARRVRYAGLEQGNRAAGL